MHAQKSEKPQNQPTPEAGANVQTKGRYDTPTPSIDARKHSTGSKEIVSRDLFWILVCRTKDRENYKVIAVGEVETGQVCRGSRNYVTKAVRKVQIGSTDEVTHKEMAAQKHFHSKYLVPREH